ncbi:MAG: hypothetical protein ACOCQG_00655 [Candidatus Nanoarchaeia archaeon]
MVSGLKRDEFGLPPYYLLKQYCPVLKFFNTLGRNWVYPLLIRMEQDQYYTFPELIQITSKRMPKSSLSKLLLDMENLKLMKKKNGKYKLTKDGLKILEILREIQNIITQLYPDRLEVCHEICGQMKYFKTEPCRKA